MDVNALTRGVDICPYCIRGAGKLWGHQGKHLRKLKEDKNPFPPMEPKPSWGGMSLTEDQLLQTLTNSHLNLQVM